MDHRELTLTELLDDPMTLAVMAADRVDPAALKALLNNVLVRRLQHARPAQPIAIREYIGRDDRRW
jgi:hypothetical protein